MKRYKPIITVLFIVYALIMLWLLLIRNRIGGDPELSYIEQLRSMPVPFQTIIQFVRIIVTGKPAYLIPHAWHNLLGNTVLFVPMGFFLPCLFERCRSAKQTFWTILVIIACVEITQCFALLGSLDFDDFMLNTVSAMFGYWLWKCICGKFGD